jgi:hypothetical protein
MFRSQVWRPQQLPHKAAGALVDVVLAEQPVPPEL